MKLWFLKMWLNYRACWSENNTPLQRGIVITSQAMIALALFGFIVEAICR